MRGLEELTVSAHRKYAINSGRDKMFTQHSSLPTNHFVTPPTSYCVAFREIPLNNGLVSPCWFDTVADTAAPMHVELAPRRGEAVPISGGRPGLIPGGREQGPDHGYRVEGVQVVEGGCGQQKRGRVVRGDQGRLIVCLLHTACLTRKL